MSCILRLSGEKFDVDSCLQSITIKPDTIRHIGEPRIELKQSGEIFTTSGCTFVASRADFDQFNEQVSDVIAFLKDNHQDLQKLTEASGIEDIWLDFGVAYDEYKFVQSKSIPLELIKHCAELNISIELSIYAPPADE